jgi:hypothetical protein
MASKTYVETPVVDGDGHVMEDWDVVLEHMPT